MNEAFMKFSLLVLTSGKQEGKVLEIKLPQFLIGRDPQCNLRPASPLISKRHCALIVRDGKAFIRDFGSMNGTYLNDQRVEGEQELKNDDQLKVGPIHFTVRLEVPAAPKPAAPNKTPLPPTRPVTKAAPAPNDTPVPATGKAKFVPSNDDDVDITAMLLGMDDGEEGSSFQGDGVPDGSTVMDLVIPPEILAMKAAEAKSGGKPAAKPGTGDTRSAAAKILDQMTKRPRS
jgi:pSer/pThr/pTyr-binding forkhead associated (FHA) protein